VPQVSEEGCREDVYLIGDLLGSIVGEVVYLVWYLLRECLPEYY